MLPRLWIVLLGLLLLAAPADARSVEAVDSHAIALVDDVELAVIELAVPEQRSDPCRVPNARTEIIVTAPEQAGVFRPPRRVAG